MNRSWPEGRLNYEDDGELEVRVGELEGNVFMAFGKPTDWIAGPSGMMRSLAAMILHYCDEVDAS